MTTREVTVRAATRTDRRRLLELLTAAFAHDPVVGWMLGPDATVARRRLFFRGLTRHALRRGWCDLALEPADGGDQAVVGAAVWYPPNGLPTGVHQLAMLPDLVRAFRRRLAAASAADTTMLSHHPAVPHWYLQFIGVRPDRTGRGIGSALLAHRLASIDRQGLAAYLESSSPRNDPLYARHGFVRTETLRLGAGAPPESLMLRPPHPIRND